MRQPDTIYVLNSILGWRVLGYRNNHRIAYHIWGTDTIRLDQSQLIENLQNDNIPVCFSGFLYGTRQKSFSAMKRTQRGFCYHPQLIEQTVNVKGEYSINDKNELVLERIHFIMWEHKSIAHPEVWNYMDTKGSLTTENYVDLVLDNHPNAKINKFNNNIYINNIIMTIYVLH